MFPFGKIRYSLFVVTPRAEQHPPQTPGIVMVQSLGGLGDDLG